MYWSHCRCWLFAVLACPPVVRAFVALPSPTTTTGPAITVRQASSLPDALEAHCRCQVCGEPFASRNGVFRHLRSSASCIEQLQARAQAASKNNDKRTNQAAAFAPSSWAEKHKVVLRFGYYNVYCAAQAIASNPRIPWNHRAAQRVQSAFVHALKECNVPVFQPEQQPLQHEENSGRHDAVMDLSTYTLSSAAHLRHASLAQDPDCPAVTDVMSLSYHGGGDIQRSKDRLLIAMNDYLQQQQQQQQHQQQRAQEKEENDQLRVHLFDFYALPKSSSRFHAEQRCTQRTYHYLLPVSWLGPQGQVAHEWVLQQHRAAGTSSGSNSSGTAHGGGHQPRGSIAVPQVIKRLKHALQQAKGRRYGGESQPTRTRTSLPHDKSQHTTSPGRFGALWKTPRRSFHNFVGTGTRSAGSSFSPSHKSTWRALDQARIVDYHVVDNNSTETAHAVLEFKGDGFLTHQLRHMIGAIVAVARGWLPADFFDMATRPDVILTNQADAPAQGLQAPAGRMYLDHVRFHFDELSSGGDRWFYPRDCPQHSAWRDALRSQLLSQEQQSKMLETENDWLVHLEHVVAPRLREHLERVQQEDILRMQQRQERRHHSDCQSTNATGVSLHRMMATPTIYRTTLALLRSISDQWPRTSLARSRVLRSSPQGSECRGSFTVIHPGRASPATKVPLGNALFPELVQAVFDLEAILVNNDSNHNQRISPQRLLSSHCAINRNAEFTPHVDSGRGQGQSLSMIVGLGDYQRGGALVVEGKKYDIHYAPLEFDGWKERHWTEPFQGERFSLVWFTPAVGTGNASSDSSEKDEGNERQEDRRARELVQWHYEQQLHEHPGHYFSPLQFRPKSTDALVIQEILDHQGCVYESGDFSLDGHECVLDIGAHIGVFARFAISKGCLHVICYEPEPRNLELLHRNLESSIDGKGNASSPVAVEIYGLAVAHGEGSIRNFVRARNRNDGTMNTWRHSLEEYSQYEDKPASALPSPAVQEAILTREKVRTVPLFGGALQPGVTFVKLDCEGAEVDLLLEAQSRRPEAWLDTTHVALEWSFTKERRVEQFHIAVNNLEAAGFSVSYEGRGSWWDTEDNMMWPYNTDLVVFGKRENKTMQPFSRPSQI